MSRCCPSNSSRPYPKIFSVCAFTTAICPSSLMMTMASGANSSRFRKFSSARLSAVISLWISRTLFGAVVVKADRAVHFPDEDRIISEVQQLCLLTQHRGFARQLLLHRFSLEYFVLQLLVQPRQMLRARKTNGLRNQWQQQHCRDA